MACMAAYVLDHGPGYSDSDHFVLQKSFTPWPPKLKPQFSGAKRYSYYKCTITVAFFCKSLEFSVGVYAVLFLWRCMGRCCLCVIVLPVVVLDRRTLQSRRRGASVAAAATPPLTSRNEAWPAGQSSGEILGWTNGAFSSLSSQPSRRVAHAH